TSAIWSASVHDARAFPWTAWRTFCENHGLLQLTDRPQWRSIAGGSRIYVDALLRRLGSRVQLGTTIRNVVRTAAGVRLWPDTATVQADAVVLAVHANDAHRLLRDATDEERAALDGIAYTTNEIVLHTDVRQLPSRRAARAAWNFRMADCAQE